MKKVRVLLAQVGRRNVFKIVAPPMGVLYLAAYARREIAADVTVFDQRAADAPGEELVRRAVEVNAEVVGLSCLTSDGHMLPGIVRDLRTALPHARIILGGPHASAFGASLLDEVDAHALVVGEGEIVFTRILEAYAGGAGFEAVPGLLWRDLNGDIRINEGEAPLIQDLDSLPFPAYDLVDISRYWPLWNPSMIPPPRKYINLCTSRGCPYRCTYCHKIHGKQFRAHSPERVTSEMDYYRQTFGVTDFEIMDDVFNLNPERVLRIADLVLRGKNRPKITFSNGLRTDIITREIADALAAMGTNYIACALESGSPRIQEYIGKRLDIPRFLQGVEFLAKKRIFCWGFLMFGFPTETEADAEETVRVATQSRLHGAWMFHVIPYPNTVLYDLAKRDAPGKLMKVDFRNTDLTRCPAVNLSDIPDHVLVTLVRRAAYRIHLSPGRLARIARDFPRRRALVRYVPHLIKKIVSPIGR